MARRLLVAIIALLLAAQIVRNAAVAGLADRFPDFASRIWRGHPSSEIALAMSLIGSAARERKAIADLRPSLNLEGNSAHPFYAALSEITSEMRRRAMEPTPPPTRH